MEFYLTKMGHKFYTADVPRIARALERIADALEKQCEDACELCEEPDAKGDKCRHYHQPG